MSPISEALARWNTSVRYNLIFGMGSWTPKRSRICAKLELFFPDEHESKKSHRANSRSARSSLLENLMAHYTSLEYFHN